MREWVINWFETNAQVDREILMSSLDKNYLEEEWLDSFSFITLLGDIEEKLGVELSEGDLEGDEIFTINGLAEILERPA